MDTSTPRYPGLGLVVLGIVIFLATLANATGVLNLGGAGWSVTGPLLLIALGGLRYLRWRLRRGRSATAGSPEAAWCQWIGSATAQR